MLQKQSQPSSLIFLFWRQLSPCPLLKQLADHCSYLAAALTAQSASENSHSSHLTPAPQNDACEQSQNDLRLATNQIGCILCLPIDWSSRSGMQQMDHDHHCSLCLSGLGIHLLKSQILHKFYSEEMASFNLIWAYQGMIGLREFMLKSSMVVTDVNLCSNNFIMPLKWTDLQETLLDLACHVCSILQKIAQVSPFEV